MSKPTIREFVGGHLNGETLVVHTTSIGCILPVTVRGETMRPPRWGLYKLCRDDFKMHHHGDFYDFTAGMQRSMDIEREREAAIMNHDPATEKTP